RHRLTVAAGHLDHDLQWFVAEVVREIGSDAERGLAATLEIFEELDRKRYVQRIREHHRLRAGIDAHFLIMRDELLAPFERIARIVANAVEQLAEEKIEVAQERVHSADVGQGAAEVAPILARPGVELEHLR